MPNTRYSIKDLENFTEIKSHTIRIWEQRYNLLVPRRTETNIRYYSVVELKKILNIKLLYDNGVKISKIAQLKEAEILETAKNIILSANNEIEKKINDLTLLILSYKKEEIWAFLNDEIKSRDLSDLYATFILPLLRKMGELWQVNSITIMQEHFFSYLFREFVLQEINKLDSASNAKKALLFLHDQEEHEFGILMYHYLLKKRGFNCFYFGQKVPIRELELAQKNIQPDLVVTTLTAKLNELAFEKILHVLEKLSNNSKVLVSGNQLVGHEADIPKNIHYLRTISEFTDLIDKEMKG